MADFKVHHHAIWLMASMSSFARRTNRVAAKHLRGCLPGRFYCFSLSGCRLKECYRAGRSQSMNSTWFIGLRRAPRKMATRRPSVT
jgi:hypothetical protein